MRVDLHGLTEIEAQSRVYMVLLDFEMSSDEQLEIITGRGAVLTRVVETVLEDEGWEYSRGSNNPGAYIVYK